MSTLTYRFYVGMHECIVLNDGFIAAPPEFLFRNAPAAELHRALARWGWKHGPVPAGLNTLLVRTDSGTVLFDTGTGGRWHDGLGRQAEGLAAAGVDPRDIDHVVLSHGHPDHIGGVLTPDGALRFPEARFVLSRAEWNYWTAEPPPAVDASWVEVASAALPPIRDRVQLVDRATEVAPGVRVRPAPGHTPGHLGLVVEDGGEQLWCFGDAVGHPVTIERPEWLVATDADANQTIETRHGLYDAAARGGTVFVNHFTFPGLGRIERDGDGGCRWIPTMLPD